MAVDWLIKSHDKQVTLERGGCDEILIENDINMKIVLGKKVVYCFLIKYRLILGGVFPLALDRGQSPRRSLSSS
jgi:hypothetical protein